MLIICECSMTYSYSKVTQAAWLSRTPILCKICARVLMQPVSPIRDAYDQVTKDYENNSDR